MKLHEIIEEGEATGYRLQNKRPDLDYALAGIAGNYHKANWAGFEQRAFNKGFFAGVRKAKNKYYKNVGVNADGTKNYMYLAVEKKLPKAQRISRGAL